MSARRALACLALTAALLPAAGARAADPAIATFSGGCFWCMEPPFEALPGVVSVTSGYTGGEIENPSYEQVSAGGTGHAESVRIVYDPSKVTYEQLLDVFWHNIDPLAKDQQFCDVGSQYRSAIFHHDAEQKKLAEASRERLRASGRLKGPIQTEIVQAGPFYPAEAYHQDYATRNPLRYRYYRSRCGRDARLEEIWGADAPAH